MTHPNRAAVLALLVAAAAATAATPNTPGRAAAAPAPVAAAAASSAADRVTARRALLRLADFPDGWTASARTSAAKPSACAGFKRARATRSAHRSSPSFSSVTSQASHAVDLYANVRRARSAFAGLTSAAARTCVGDETKTKLGTIRTTVGAARTSTLRIARVGDQSAAARISVDYSASDGAARTVTLDLVFVREGRGLSLLALVDDIDTFDAKLRGRLTSTAGSRLRRLLRD